MSLGAIRKKLSHCEARSIANAVGVDFSKDFHALPSSQVDSILELAKRARYRKSKNAPGSTARMYFALLQTKRACKVGS